MNISNAAKGQILASISGADEARAVLDLFDTLAEIDETNRILSKDLGAARADIALARDENAALRQRIAELEAAALFGAEVTDND